MKKISNENVDIEQKITDGVVIDINKSMLDTDMYEVVDVVYLGNNKIKLVVKNKTIVEMVNEVIPVTRKDYIVEMVKQCLYKAGILQKIEKRD